MSFQSVNTRLARRVARLYGAVTATMRTRSWLRFVLLTGLAAVAWLLSGFVASSVAQADVATVNNDGASQHGATASTLAEAGQRVDALVTTLAAPGDATGDQPGSASDSLTAVSNQLLDHLDLDSAPLELTDPATPLADQLRPLALPVHPATVSVVETERSVDARPASALSSETLDATQESSFIHKQHAAAGDSPTGDGDRGAAGWIGVLAGNMTSFPAFPTGGPTGVPGNPVGVAGMVNTHSGPGVGPQIGAGFPSDGFATPEMSDDKVVGLADVTYIRADLHRNPAVWPD